MKRCPECRRDYYDDTLLYCLDDGNALLEGPATVGASGDEPATAILSEPGAVATGFPADEPQTAILSEPGAVATGFRPDEAQTRPHILTTDQTAILPSDSVPDGDASRARQLTRGSGKSEGRYGLRSGPRTERSSTGSPRIWIMNGDGSSPRQLTQDFSYLPTVSPDGRYIVYGSLGAGTIGTWRIDIDGGNPKLLADNRGLFTSISPDGRWVIIPGPAV